MAQASGVQFCLQFDRIPFISGARKYAEQWIFPGGSADNRLFYGQHVRFAQEISEMEQMLLFDAQTSGGLLLSVPAEKIPAFEKRAAELGQSVWVVGEVAAGVGIDVVR
jgi:selenide,water dikinase